MLPISPHQHCIALHFPSILCLEAEKDVRFLKQILATWGLEQKKEERHAAVWEIIEWRAAFLLPCRSRFRRRRRCPHFDVTTGPQRRRRTEEEAVSHAAFLPAAKPAGQWMIIHLRVSFGSRRPLDSRRTCQNRKLGSLSSMLRPLVTSEAVWRLKMAKN